MHNRLATSAEGLLAHMAHGHAVVTTRLANLSGFFTPLEVDVLSLEASVEFLIARTEGRRVKMASDAADARKIAESLGQLALALEQAGAYVAQDKSSFADHLREWKTQSAELLDWHDASVTGYPRSVAVTWNTSVARLSDNARALLEHLAFLAPEPAPRALFDVPLPGLDAELRAAFREIANYSLVTRHAERPTFVMHRLAQDVTRRSVEEAQWEVRGGAVLRWLGAAIDEERKLPAPERRALLLALVLHTEALSERTVSVNAKGQAYYLLVLIGDAFLEAGSSVTAGRAQSRALGVAKDLAEGDPGDAGFQRDLMVSCVKLAAVGDRPAEHYREALAIAEALAVEGRLPPGWSKICAGVCARRGMR